jgi:putative ABC transport system permease protein
MRGTIAAVLEMVATLRISAASLPERSGTALVAVLGFAGVVLVLTGMLSISAGFSSVVKRNGSPDVAVVMRGGSTSEISSGLSGDAVRAIGQAPGVKRNGDQPEVSAEVLVVVDVAKRSTGKDSNVPFRGVSDQAFRLHPKFRVIDGRLYEPGRGEVVVGRQAASEFAGLEIGAKRRWQGFEWTVVGVFEAGGGLEESEIWTDDRTLQTAFERGVYYQSAYARLESVDSFKRFKDALTSNPQLNVTVQRQDEYLKAQTEALAIFISVAGYAIALLMGLGAVFGAINAMYSAVAARTLEIATLRALGFGRFPVVVSVLLEGMLLGVVGGALGGAVAWLMFNGYQASTLNFMSFSQVAFEFAVTPSLMAQGLVYALVLGFVGGLAPAVRAARLPIAAALRMG